MAKHPTDGRRAALCDWLTANNIDPNLVLTDADLTTADTEQGRVIRVEVCVVDEAGRKTLGERGHIATEIRTVPLVVEPPAWFGPYEKPTREQLLATIERVRKQHTHVTVTDTCYQCSMRDYPDYAVPFPCPTVRALDGEEQR